MPTTSRILSPPVRRFSISWRRFGYYDPLAMVLDLAHEHDIRVHAWLNVYLVWSGKEPPDGHVVLEDPEWVASDRDGTSMAMMSKRAFASAWTEGVYLDPDGAMSCSTSWTSCVSWSSAIRWTAFILITRAIRSWT